MTSPGNVGCQIGSFVVMLIAFVAFLVAFSTNYWIDTGGTTYGLWRACSGDLCAGIIGNDLTTVAFISAQILFCLGLTCCAISVGGHVAWVMRPGELTCLISWGAQIASSFVTALALILWGNESFRYFGANYLSWSYWLMMFSAVVMAFTGGIAACKTACATRLERGKPLVYSSTMATRGAVDQYPGHDTSDYSDLTQSDYSMANMAPHGRPLPPHPGGWGKQAGYSNNSYGQYGNKPKY